MKQTCFVILTTFCLVNCQAPKAIETAAELYVRYDAENSLLVAEASFFDLKTGSPTSMEMGTGVAFINSGMELSQLPRGKFRYRYSHEGKLPGELKFRWKTDSGDEAIVPVQMSMVEGLECREISLSKGFDIKINGSPLADDEKLTITLFDKNRKGVNLDLAGPSKDLSFQIAPDRFYNLAKGTCEIGAVRSRHSKKVEGDTKIVSVTEFYSKATKVEVVD